MIKQRVLFLSIHSRFPVVTSNSDSGVLETRMDCNRWTLLTLDCVRRKCNSSKTDYWAPAHLFSSVPRRRLVWPQQKVFLNNSSQSEYAERFQKGINSDSTNFYNRLVISTLTGLILFYLVWSFLFNITGFANSIPSAYKIDITLSNSIYPHLRKCCQFSDCVLYFRKS